ncbi:hypothetical protein QE390_001920 [Siphonobacter sp. SORGH_AS 1065]|nr:hypothetical protein [Siphonobacter sp. SORGH_AS_1065]
MKLFLEQMLPEKQSAIRRPVIDEREVITDDLVNYKGSVWRAFLFYALLVYAFGFPFIFINSVNRVPFGFLMYAGLVFIFWRLAVHTLHNFSLSDEEFMIKNSLWPGYQKVIPLRKVREVIYEIKGKGMHALTLVREDFQKQSFIAEGLSEQEWLDLREQLWQKGLNVRNECIHPGENQRKESVE